MTRRWIAVAMTHSRPLPVCTIIGTEPLFYTTNAEASQ